MELAARVGHAALAHWRIGAFAEEEDMNAFQRMAAVTAGTTLALGLAACSSQQNDLSGKLATAESRLTSAQVEARQNVNDIDTKYAENRATAVTQGKHNIADAQKGITDAKSAIEQNREYVGRSTGAQIERLNAEAKGYRARARNFTGDKKTAFDTEWTKYQASLSETRSKHDALDGATNETWSATRNSLMRSLSSLSTSVGTLGKFF